MDFGPIKQTIADFEASETAFEGLVAADKTAQDALVNATATANGTATAVAGGKSDLVNKAQAMNKAVADFVASLTPPPPPTA